MATDGIPPLEIFPNYQQRLATRSGLSRLLLTAFPFIPRHAYHPFLSEMRIALATTMGSPARVRRAFRNRKDLLVNIGCAEEGKPGWVNVDVVRAAGVNCIYDCRRDLPFADASVRGIFTEHFLEHIDYTEELPSFLSECHRVLVPGGVMRIIVPDAERYIRAYCAEGWDDLTAVRRLNPDHTDGHYGSRFHTKMEVVNAVFRQYFEHKYAYDFATLEFVLRRYGFDEVLHQSVGQSCRPELAIDKPDRAAESLYVEAVKREVA
jgi:predicted SAM-dependent methyltransferase